MAFVRRSKYKHIYGKPNKREECYDGIRITKSSWDSTFCSVNPKYLAIITEAAGGGAFLVLPLEKVGRVEAEAPLVAGHKAAVLDIQWCPFNDDVIASASEDCTAKVWLIPEGGIDPKNILTEPVADLVAHQRRVGLVLWHPTAENVLLTSGADNLVIIWNVEREEPLVEISFPDMVLSASFSYNGSKLVTTCKDRTTRVVNPRSGEVIVEGKCHEGSKPQQCVYMKNNRIFTTGFSRISERQYALWADTDLDSPLTIQDLDTTNGVLFPFYDQDCGLIFLCGKGDSCIRYYEISDDEPYIHPINMLTSSDPQRGIGWLPKRGLTVNNNEIARCFKLHQKGLCEVIPFTVPRKSELFQDDLYPDTPGDVPAMTADEWFQGKDADPVLMSLKDSFIAKDRSQKKAKASKLTSKRGTISSSAPSDSKANSTKTVKDTDATKDIKQQSEILSESKSHSHDLINEESISLSPDLDNNILDQINTLTLNCQELVSRVEKLETDLIKNCDAMSRVAKLENELAAYRSMSIRISKLEEQVENFSDTTLRVGKLEDQLSKFFDTSSLASNGHSSTASVFSAQSSVDTNSCGTSVAEIRRKLLLQSSSSETAEFETINSSLV